MLPRTGITHIVTDQRELRKILFEARGKMSRVAVKGFLVCARIARNEHLARYIRARRGRVQPEDRISIHLDIVKCSADGCSHHRSCVVDVDALTNPVWTTGPAGVDEIAAHAVLFYALAQQVGILTRLQRQKRSAKARAERRLWSGHTRFGSRQFACIAGQEIIHRLFCSQLLDWRQDPKPSSRKATHTFWMSSSSRFDHVIDEVDRVGRPCVLRY